jgi:hypothetical protein
MQKGLIFALLLLLAPIVEAQTIQILPKNDLYVINERTRIGGTTRVKSYNQDPYPFCFSAAASLLWDQTRCQYDKKNCKDFERTSFLAITGSGQKVGKHAIKTQEGGYGVHSLEQLVADGGGPPYSVCNYRPSEEVTPNQLYLNTFVQLRNDFLKYKDWTPYLERVHRKLFIDNVKRTNASLTESRIYSILNGPDQTEFNLAASILLHESCFAQEYKRDDRFKIVQKDLKSDGQDQKIPFVVIDKLLSQKIPVYAGICLYRNLNTGRAFKDCGAASHALVIVAKAKATHKVTGDQRTFYWVVNTWGETWQAANADGWISAEDLLMALYGELIWLEPK